MNRLLVCLICLAALVALGHPRQADAVGARRADRNAARFARTLPWHGSYYHTAWGRPLALVVPPTSTTQASMSWGVAQSAVMPIYHQFRRPYPGDIQGLEVQLYPTPHWPSHTDQFGVYYIRGPW